jgi:hypothetical protein
LITLCARAMHSYITLYNKKKVYGVDVMDKVALNNGFT